MKKGIIKKQKKNIQDWSIERKITRMSPNLKKSTAKKRILIKILLEKSIMYKILLESCIKL